ncbi:hypothetical protein, partial [uncultured Rothia sp.]|uniref:hypothetical protein n=1 Tax=uncultured Rothia sp. TaxID=316088 RepID=UPI002629A324
LSTVGYLKFWGIFFKNTARVSNRRVIFAQVRRLVLRALSSLSPAAFQSPGTGAPTRAYPRQGGKSGVS